MIALLCLFALPALAADGHLEATVQQFQEARPDAMETVSRFPAVRNRSGTFRLIGADASPELAPAYLARALDTTLPTPVRAAHARFAGSITEDPGLVTQVVDSGDADVRRAFVAGLVHNDADVLAPVAGLTVASDPLDRRLAVTVLSRRADVVWRDTLVQSAADLDPETRYLAVRALGVLEGVPVGVFAERLQDDNAKVRLTALRALERQDPTVAKRLAVELVDDPDPSLRRAAESLVTGEARIER